MGAVVRISLALITMATVTLAALGNVGTAAGATRKLPALGADPARTSVSGLSSGAFMAVQYSVAFSASTIGMGIIAGGPYNCVFVNLGGIDTCMSGGPDGAASFAAAQGFASLGQIDPATSLAAQKLYLFSGTNDQVVKQTVMNAVLDFLHAAHVPPASIQYVRQYPAGHAFISPAFGNACGVTATPFVDECAVTAGPGSAGANYDQPNAILTQIYGPLSPAATTLSSKPVAFDQTEFISPVQSAMSSMADNGFVYVPASCSKASSMHCAVHVVFHGCEQGAQAVRDAVYGKVGYNSWADTNGIIVLYPQAVVSDFIPFNPKGCWDWWGYSGLDFQVQGGVQLAAVRAMVARLTTPRK
jgi:poly(3-hydroxybutyrate) depolymerase